VGLQFRVESPGGDTQRSMLKMMFMIWSDGGGGKEKVRGVMYFVIKQWNCVGYGLKVLA